MIVKSRRFVAADYRENLHIGFKWDFDKLMQDADEFIMKLGKNRIISVSETEFDVNDDVASGKITVWYWENPSQPDQSPIPLAAITRGRHRRNEAKTTTA